MSRTVFTALTILAVLALIYGCKKQKSQAESEMGRTATEFILKSCDDRTISLSDYDGKIVVLEWLNYECPFVKYHYEKEKTMIELANKYEDKDVVWLAINSTGHSTMEKNKEFSEKHKLPYPILDDRAGRTGRAYGAKNTPHMFIIETRGKIAYSGAIDNSPLGKKTENMINYVDKALEELINGKEVSISKTEPYGCSVKYAN